MKIKTNPYNFIIPIEQEEESLLYNSLTNGLEIIDNKEAELLSEFMNLTSFDTDEQLAETSFIEHLLDREYLIPAELNLKDHFRKYIENNQYKDAKIINLTIGTTITCNMGCPYCFEFIKPNHTLKKDEVKERIGRYIEEIINKSNRDIETLSVTWYGGEPLINVTAIKDLSEIFQDIVHKYNLNYKASIITNGIYLTEKNIQLLDKYKVHSVQVTIDGAKEHHNKKRPLKQKNKRNYEVIMENLAKFPIDSDFQLNIRMNIDKEVSESAFELLDDFERYGIWPMKHKIINFDPAWLRSYDEINTSEEELALRLGIDQFFEFKQRFREELVTRFNRWSGAPKRAKLKWDLPSYQSTCATWASPISLTIDPNGYVHKCWETIHDDKQAPTSVFETYSEERFIPYSSFNRYEHNEVCTNCKFLPICDTITCSHEAINNTVPNCTAWKYKLEDYLKGQYLKLKHKPNSITKPFEEGLENTGHSAK